MTGMKVVEDVRPPLGERNDVVERQMVSLRADTLGYGLLADVADQSLGFEHLGVTHILGGDTGPSGVHQPNLGM
jgi:hypothetical protein